MKEVIAHNIRAILMTLQKEGSLPIFEISKNIAVEPPKTPEFGEYTSPIALTLAGTAQKNPLEIATLLAGKLTGADYAVEAVAPGHLNFTLTDKVLTEVLQKIQKEQGGYGVPAVLQKKIINNEFISANPTGPLHVGNGRGGYFGDSLTRLLRKMGHEVKSEYYVNDGGEQITKLGHSVLKDEEAVYGGEYIEELHVQLGKSGESPEAVGEKAAQALLEESIKKTVGENMGIVMDAWTSERAILESGKVIQALDILSKNGHTYEAEGALWLRTTDFGDDKDRVLKKSDGSYTYFASDAGHILGYREDKVEIILETFGADHHGYTKRFEAVARALGFTGEIHFTLMQLVKLEKDGAPVRMSKRAGNTVTMDDLIERVGRDVTRFFFLMYSPDTHMTFDLGLAEERSQKNPVFYVQYAHARMASIMRKAEELGWAAKPQGQFTHPKERALARELYLFPEFLARAARDYAPHRLAQYAIGLADIFHSFYGAAKVLEEDNKEQSEHRLALVYATQIVLAEALRLVGVSAPEEM
jgi:arginyl-tRNA synthetase